MKLQHAAVATPLISGSSKDFYSTEDPHVLLMICKDNVHGRGRQASIPGTGRLRELFCFHFYSALETLGISTHLAREYCGRPLGKGDALQPSGILVRRLDMVRLELIARYVARGQWVDAHKIPLLEAGEPLAEPTFDCCLKWRACVRSVEMENMGARNRMLWRLLGKVLPAEVLAPATLMRDDPRVPPDVLIALNRHCREPELRARLIRSHQEWEQLRTVCLRVFAVLREMLLHVGLTLEDGKIEVGLIPDSARAEFILGDECSQDSIRVRAATGQPLSKDLFRQGRTPEELVVAYGHLVEVLRTLPPATNLRVVS